jgi:hypothetical protein
MLTPPTTRVNGHSKHDDVDQARRTHGARTRATAQQVQGVPTKDLSARGTTPIPHMTVYTPIPKGIHGRHPMSDGRQEPEQRLVSRLISGCYTINRTMLLGMSEEHIKANQLARESNLWRMMRVFGLLIGVAAIGGGWTANAG